MPIFLRTCVECGAEFEAGSYRVRMCSDACRERRQRAMGRDQARRSYWNNPATRERHLQYSRSRRVKRSEQKTCCECGATFEAVPGIKKTCSDACRSAKRSNYNRRYREDPKNQEKSREWWQQYRQDPAVRANEKERSRRRYREDPSEQERWRHRIQDLKNREGEQERRRIKSATLFAQARAIRCLLADGVSPRKQRYRPEEATPEGRARKRELERLRRQRTGPREKHLEQSRRYRARIAAQARAARELLANHPLDTVPTQGNT